MSKAKKHAVIYGQAKKSLEDLYRELVNETGKSMLTAAIAQAILEADRLASDAQEAHDQNN